MYSISSHGKIVYRWGRYTLFARLLRILVCCNGTACGFICIVPRAKHQLRCGNDLALAALSRSVSPFLPLLPSRSSPTAPLVASQRQELSDFLGYEYATRGCKRLEGDGISNAVNEKQRRGSTSKKECASFEEAEQRNLNMRDKQDDNAILIITFP